MSLPSLRQRIDQLDARILRLLNQRAALAMRVGRLKKRQGRHLYDPEREQAVLRQIAERNHGPLSRRAVRAIYREILRQVRQLEQSASLLRRGRG